MFHVQKLKTIRGKPLLEFDLGLFTSLSFALKPNGDFGIGLRRGNSRLELILCLALNETEKKRFVTTIYDKSEIK